MLSSNALAVFMCFVALLNPKSMAQTIVDYPPPLRASAVEEGAYYHLFKNWDFSANVLNDGDLRREFYTRYIYSNGTLDYLNDEWEVYRDNNNHLIAGGVLKLIAQVPFGELLPHAVESGMLRSKWTGKYGYFEAPVKLPKSRGMWPIFWLNPEDEKWPPEIDIFEVVNNGADGCKNSFHYLHSQFEGDAMTSMLDSHETYRPGIDYCDSFHTFAIEWTPSVVKHYVDNVLVIERKFQWRHDDGRDGGPAHILLNLAVGGRWPGRPKNWLTSRLA